MGNGQSGVVLPIPEHGTSGYGRVATLKALSEALPHPLYKDGLLPPCTCLEVFPQGLPR